MSALASKHYIALCGGVGGAKLALGLSHVLAPEDLTIIVNTGDDFRHLGLPISPDLDTVMYTLAGVSNPKQGWGRDAESWVSFDTLKSLGGSDWFQLGDKDIALHLRRRELLDAGFNLSEAIGDICQHLGIKHSIVPMSNLPVATVMKTVEGELPFQHYFVKEQCQPVVTGYRFDGIEKALPSKAFLEALNADNLAGIIICPSNPFVSIEPILSIPGISDIIQQLNVPVLAVSPIVGGQAIKGPAAKMSKELNIPLDATGIANFYKNLVDIWVLDTADRDVSLTTNCETYFTPTLMTTLDHKINLAKECLALLDK